MAWLWSTSAQVMACCCAFHTSLTTLQWRHTKCDGVSNDRSFDCWFLWKGPVMRFFFIDDLIVRNYNGSSPDVSLAFTYSNQAVSLGYINDTYDAELCDKCCLMKILGRKKRLLQYTEYINDPEIIIQMLFITKEIIGLIRSFVWHDILPDVTINVLNCIRNLVI